MYDYKIPNTDTKFQMQNIFAVMGASCKPVANNIQGQQILKFLHDDQINCKHIILDLTAQSLKLPNAHA